MKPIHPKFWRARQGFALILVLAVLVLCTAFVLAFFLSVRQERASASLDASGSEVRDLAASTLNIAVAQIKDATAGVANPADPTSKPVAWASQPGLIRTFDGALVSAFNPSGQFKAYKLYSAASLTGDSTFDPNTPSASGGDQPPTDWYSPANHAIYTDLNAPVTNINNPDPVNSLVYPIVDPRASPDYPTKGANPNGVNGFGISSDAPVDATAKVPNPAPMPVQWLYQLQDGTLATGTSGGNNIAKVAGATSKNPVVARVAFWTDDDSCKVNINTAAGDEWQPQTTALEEGNGTTPAPGSYWAVPRLSAAADREGLAKRLPATAEYQRFPGHPATTYLSAVFPWLTRAQIASLAPRIQSGGTLGGTQAANPSVPIALDKDRLYASVDELAFASPTTGGDRPLQNTIVQPTQVEQTRFFLTAHSRAPELNLFGQPRIGIWPEWDTTATGTRTPFDNLIAFCSTIGQGIDARPYYFTRKDPSSATVDGLLARNQQLYAYLHNLTSLTVPGFKSSFASKYGADQDQILTEIFDYIRCTNLADQSSGATAYTPLILSSGDDGPGVVIPTKMAGNGTRGFGRFPVVSEVALLLYYYNTNLDASPPSDNPPPLPAVQGVLMLEHYCPENGAVPMFPDFKETITGLDSITLQPIGGGGGSVAFHNGTNHITAQSWTWEQAYGGLLGWEVGFFGRQSLGGASTGNTPSGYPFYTSPMVVPATTNLIGVRGGTITITLSDNKNGATIQTMQVAIPTQAFQMPDVAPRYVPGPPSNPPPPNGVYYSWTADGRHWNLSKFDNRLSAYQIHNNGVPPLIARNGPISGAPVDPRHNFPAITTGTGDVVKSIEPGGTIKGDLRLLALNESAPTAYFAPHADYTLSSNNYTAHSLRGAGTGSANLWYNDPGNELGKLDTAAPALFISNLPSAPDVPSSLINGAVSNIGYAGTSVEGDWDNGCGDSLDGPMINKADEGWVGGSPYYGGQGGNTNSSPGTTQFSPNRLISSPVHFGSLSTGLKSGVPWRTLLFCPNPAAGSIPDSTTNRYMANHFGRTDPPDHLLLDLFNMPVVEPYAESEPFSTAGKINLNYQIAPFSYIERTTGLRALLRSVRVTAIPTSAAKNQDDTGGGFANYKTYWWDGGPRVPNFRNFVDADKTLQSFDHRFGLDRSGNNQPFKTASQICEMYLYPAAADPMALPNPPAWDAQDSGIANWWMTGASDPVNPNILGYKLTGDNLREEPYDLLYPRLTTQSNTYTVHMRVQKLKKAKFTDQTVWDENRDVIEGEYRGSYTVERFLDSNDPRFASSNANYIDPDAKSLAPAYKIRVVENKKFAP